MLAGELALAGVDVAIVERRAEPGARRLARGRSARTHDRGARSARHRRALPRRRGRSMQVAGFALHPARHQRLPDAPQLRARALAEPHRAHPRRLGRRAGRADPSRARGDGLRAGRRRRRRRAVRRRSRCGRSTSSDATAVAACPQGGRHRLPGLGPVGQLPDRRGRDDRGAGARASATTTRASTRSASWTTASACGVVLIERAGRRSGEPTLRRASRGARSPSTAPTSASTTSTWLSRFTDAARQAASYRAGTRAAGRRRGARAFPAGGQGLNIGVQDAVNLGWKLAQVVKRHLAGEPARHLPGRAAPDRCARAAEHAGADRAQPRRRTHARRCARPSPSCSRWTSRASDTPG